MKRFYGLVLSLIVAAPLAGQNTDIEALSGLTFNFRNPGARSLGMGGAFLALADDATAAEANPAGLTILRVPEISLEVRNFRMDVEVPFSGAYPDITKEAFVSHSRRAEISYGSAVYTRDKWALAAYYHQPLRIESNLNLVYTFDQLNQAVPVDRTLFYLARGNPRGTGGLVTRDECDALQNEEFGSCTTFQLSPYFSSVTMEQETWGVAGAYEFGPVSVGLGVRYQLFEQAALTVRYDPDFFFPVESLVQATELDENFEPKAMDDITFTVGVKWEINDKWFIGGTIKQGAEYPTGVFQQFAAGGEVFEEAFETSFHVPDTAGIGVAWRPIPALTLLADAVFVRYSNLVDNFRSAYPEIQFLSDIYDMKIFQIDDTVQTHVGAEYFFATPIAVALRAGWWREPAHGLKYSGPLTCTEEEINEFDRVLCSANRNRQAIVFDGGRDLDHYTVGVGLAWPKFQIDAAYDTSKDFKVGSLSAVYRF
ncbi:MAG TPA: hypothetical protein VM557_12825 [Thermoanaerobaculia bacterium]|nr:hypothetical protein [Thermoanaerobaculia bacterium]